MPNDPQNLVVTEAPVLVPSLSDKQTMATPFFFRATLLLRTRFRHHRLAVGFFASSHRPSSTAAASGRPDESVSSADKNIGVLSTKDPPGYRRWDDIDFRKWKKQESEILQDIEPIISLTKEILHSGRYMDGERLTAEDEEAVVENLLAYHPHSEDKIGCGLDSIMVDRHPQFRHSRCLFVVRTDGGWIDFSYQKCLRAYIRDKYPTSAERFIREHFKRSSG